jgi:hypothetical protein
MSLRCSFAAAGFGGLGVRSGALVVCIAFEQNRFS